MSNSKNDLTKKERSDYKILLVEDDPDSARMIKRMLSNAGFETVFSTDNVKAAIEKATHSDYDIILSDWNMPLVSGIEFLRELRKYEKCRDLPFIMLTSNKNKEDVVEAIKAGVTDYVSKDSVFKSLIPKLDSIVKALKTN